MSEYGVFAVDRAVFDHPLLSTDEPYTRREAWLWLVAQAAWKPRKVNRNGAVIQLQRGQLTHSIRFMAEAWGWSKSSVDRFLTRLKTGTMIGTEGGTASLIITICNYDAYQRLGLPERDTIRDAERDTAGTAAGQTRNIQSFKEDILSDPQAASDETQPKKKARNKITYPEDFEAAWKAYPTTPNMSKAEALPAWNRLSATEHAQVLPSIAGYRAYLATKPELEVIHFCRYLSKRRFESYAGAGVTELETPALWQKRLGHARARREWFPSKWGPAPGSMGCRVPLDLLQPSDGIGWQEARAA